MEETVQYDGRPKIAAVLPDPKCPTNKGNHSSRGGTEGRNLVNQSVSGHLLDSTRERITTPYVRTASGFEPLSVEDALAILSELVKSATGWNADGTNRTIGFSTPSGLGVKLYEYQYLENTFAATRLFYNLIGTPNVSFHDRPSVASNTQGFADAGIDPHGFAYEDIWDSDVLFIAGANSYETHSVFFMQYATGKRIVVLDPRRTITADYAVKTGGLHLQPKVLGADTLILNALARYIRDQRRRDPIGWPDRLPYDLIKKTTKPADPDEGPDNPRKSRNQMTDDEYLNHFLDTQPPIEVAGGVSGIDVSLLTEAATIMAGPAKDMVPARSRKVSLLFEKGLIWGYNYQSTAAFANLGLLLGSVLVPGKEADNVLGVTGRIGGHQKGWAEARYKVKRTTRDAEGNDSTTSLSLGYPFFNASDRFSGPDGTQLRTHHYLDSHLVGTRIAPRHKYAEPQKAEPDIKLLWLIGTNASGQVGNAEAKWKHVDWRRGTQFPRRAEKEEVIKVLLERIARNGLVVVQQDIYPNPTTNYADIVLPAAGWGEEDFSRYNGERRLKLFGKFQDSPVYRAADGGDGKTRCSPDWKIFQSIAISLLPEGYRLETIRPGYLMETPVTREGHFNWARCSDVFEDLARTSDQSSKNGLKYLVDNIPAGHPVGHEWLRQRGTRGFVLPLVSDGTPTGFRESPRAPAQASYAFVRSDWNEIKDDFEKCRPREGEFAVCNGRVNELWNSMFTNIRNETVRQRYPDNLPGTILEINVEDAKGLSVTNGDLVEVECKDIHLGGSGSFRAVVSMQSEFLPPGLVFAIFSYPVSSKRLERFPYRSFLSSGYANNITTGYVDPINPIAAVKFARGTIRKLEGRYSSRAYLGPSYSPRNRAFPIQMVENEEKRLDWKMRELIVQKGVPRVRLHAEIDRGIADAILDPEIFMDKLTHDRAFRDGFKGVLSAGVMEWRGRDGTLYDSWTQKEQQLALDWITRVESKEKKDKQHSSS
jgi:arsenite oxidase large subunit